MSGGQTRLELRIDVLDLKDQRALPLREIKPPQLIEAILLEFRELEYLSDRPAEYRLIRADDRSPLDDEDELGHQLANGSRLALVEQEMSSPGGSERPTQEIYLRDQILGRVYKLHWLPAIIGRPDKNQPHNELVAVNLESYNTGLRVSRRHAQITEKAGQYYLQSMSRNPTSIRDNQGNTIPVSAEKRPLENGDIIHLERSNIALKFIVRGQVTVDNGSGE